MVSAGILALLAAVHSRRDRRSVPLAVYFAFLFGVDLLFAFWLTPLLAAAPRPFEGWLRVALHFENGLYIGTIFGFTLAVGMIFRCRPARIAAWVLFPLSLAVLILGHSEMTTAVKASVFTAAAVGGLLANWYAIATTALLSRRVRPGTVHLAVMLLVAGDSVIILYGFLNSIAPGLAAVWDAANTTYATATLLSCFAYTAALVRREEA